jgi:hypothetical protein
VDTGVEGLWWDKSLEMECDGENIGGNLLEMGKGIGNGKEVGGYIEARF